ncbi:spectrin binding protein [Aureococcus anophagefferens]|uniref:Spectrin binding protein n=1 Tax=Aureococcus anophagefferens TaxID=44056 RepID=A0ABR1G5R9_AURAN
MRSREDSEEISLKHSGYAYVYTREGSLVAGGKWVRVAADLENLTLRLDNTHMTETNRDKYCKEMTITAGTRRRASRPGSTCSPASRTRTWTRSWNAQRASEKRRDGGDLEDALRSAPAKVEVALLALRRGRLPADYVARAPGGQGRGRRCWPPPRSGRADVIGALVGLGAARNGPELGDSEKAFETPLLGAAPRPAVAPLAAAGAVVDAADGDGVPPLVYAVRAGHVACVAALLQRDAVADAGAAAAGEAGAASARARQLVAATRDLRASLGSAAFDASSAADVARSVRSVIRDGELPLSSWHGARQLPRRRLRRGADDRFTALLRCCANGDGQGAELWLTLGAGANHADHGPEKRTRADGLRRAGRHAPREDAAGHGPLRRRRARRARVLRALPRGRGRGASRSGARGGASGRDVCALLLAHGADPLAMDAKGRSPLSVAAADARDARLVSALLAAPKAVARPAGGSGPTVAGLKRPVGSRASLQKRDARGRTALFYAAEADRPENVELRWASAGGRRWLDAGARRRSASAEMLDVDATDDSGHTALRVATAAHAKGAVGALLRFGGVSAGDAQIAHTLGRFRASVLCGDEPATLRYVDRGNFVVGERRASAAAP